jgi:hypothetical protein
MNELTLESLAKRVEALERMLQPTDAKRLDWESVEGISGDRDWAHRIEEEGQAIREAEREEARRRESA